MTTSSTGRTSRTRRRRGTVSPADRPLRRAGRADLLARFERALPVRNGVEAAHCVHELWMRGEFGANVDAMLTRLWASAAPTVPEWLPMRHIDWLPLVYDVAARFRAHRRGRHNLYLVLLDYSDSRPEPYGVYVGMTHHAPADRFDQHKAGIRAAGSVLRRGLELLTGPVMHLQGLARTEAVQIEATLAEALRAAGLFVRGGH